MTERTEKAEPFAQSPLGGIGLLVVGGLWTGFLKLLDTVPIWVTVLVYGVLILAFILNLVPAARKAVVRFPKWLWSFGPVTRRRLDEVR